MSTVQDQKYAIRSGKDDLAHADSLHQGIAQAVNAASDQVQPTGYQTPVPHHLKDLISWTEESFKDTIGEEVGTTKSKNLVDKIKERLSKKFPEHQVVEVKSHGS